MPEVRLLRFKRDFVKAGDVEIGVYRLIGETVERGYPADVLDRAIREEGEADYIVAEQQGGERSLMGEVPKRAKERFSGEGEKPVVLHPRMARLRRVALVRKKDMKEELGFFKVELSSIRWSSVEDDVYVFDGIVKAPPDVVMIILETEDGIQYVTLSS